MREWEARGQRIEFGQLKPAPIVGCPRAVVDGKWLRLEDFTSIGLLRECEAPAEPFVQDIANPSSGSAGASPSRIDTQPVLKIPVGDLFPLPGEHNRMNAAAAICAALAAGVNVETIPAGLQTFRGLPHRLELVGEVAGRRFYNDSLATTPESAICALRAFSGRLLLLAGGYDKKVDLTAFAHEAVRRCTAIAWMGQTAPQLEAMASQVGGPALAAESSTRRITDNLQAAFDWIWHQSQPGDTILLSPACASFDWFLNFADRGDQFRRLVERLRRGGEPRRHEDTKGAG